MSYRFGSKTIYLNAFHAVSNVRSYLSVQDIARFCAIIEDELSDALENIGESQCCRVTFDFDDGYLESSDNEFKVVAGRILRYGGNVTDDELLRANLCLGDGAARMVFARARERFAQELQGDAGEAKAQLPISDVILESVLV